jgi:small conductance mechanosensitive channel
MHRSIIGNTRRLPWTVLVAALALAPITAMRAQDEPPPEPQPLTEEIAEQLDQLRAQFDAQRQTVAEFASRLPDADDATRDILELRLARERLDLLQDGVRFAIAVIEKRGAFIVADYEAEAIAVLRSLPALFDEIWTQAYARALVPAFDQSAAEQAAADRVYFDMQSNIDRLISVTADSFELLAELGVEAPDALAEFEANLAARVIDASLMVDLALEEAAAVRAALNALPGDSELTAELAVAQARVARAADSLDQVVSELAALDHDVAEYRQQLLTATGAISPEDIDISVIGALASEWSDALVAAVFDEGPAFLFRALLVAAILFVFYKASRVTRRLVDSGLTRSNAALSVLLKRMITATVANLMLAFGILIALSQLGFSLGPILAGLGIAGFVVGFALQDSLSNFASGVMILFNRPYDVGDVVELGGVLGEVKEMSLVNTTVHTFDNQRVILPNTMIWSNIIKNVTAQDTRRVDLVFGISYSDDIPKTERVLRDIVESHELVLDEPAPVVRLHELGDSSVNFVVRPWTKPENYWTVYWDVTRAVKIRFDEEGVSIPFPQRDVHLFAQASAAGGTESPAP